MQLSEQQLALYFERIGLSYDAYRHAPLTRELLDTLCFAHSIHMPFENLDMVRKKPISLAPEDLYQKLIVERRGGNCFELNGLCGVFLRTLGFGVEDFLSRFFRDAIGAIPMRRHRLLKVQAEDGTFLWDIGIGMRSPRKVLRLVEGLQQKQGDEIYRFTIDSFFGWVLEEYHKEQWLPILSFTEEPQAEIDFVLPCVWCELHPDSPFHKFPIVALKTPQGRKSLDGLQMREFCGDTLLWEQTLTEETLSQCLQEHFGIVIP